MSLTSLLKPLPPTSSLGSVSCTPVAIQWQNSLQSGSSRLGASGSVIASVSCMSLLNSDGAPGTLSMNCTSGAVWSWEGESLLPTSAVACSQKMERVSCGVKESMTVGMISAFSSLRSCEPLVISSRVKVDTCESDSTRYLLHCHLPLPIEGHPVHSLRAAWSRKTGNFAWRSRRLYHH